jgi:hypothetical protein
MGLQLDSAAQAAARHRVNRRRGVILNMASKNAVDSGQLGGQNASKDVLERLYPRLTNPGLPSAREAH